MIAKWVDIDNGAWRIVVNYDVTPEDWPYIAKQLRSIGASAADMERASKMFRNPNEAFTISDDEERMSLVCIGWVTSKSQYHNSVVHEIDHVQRDVLEYYGVKCGSEDAAYLQGYIAQEMLL